MSTFTLVGAGIAIATCFPLCKAILNKSVVQSLAAWMLWAILDVIIAVSIILQQGNFLLPIAFTVTSSIICFCIWKANKTFKWTIFETRVTIMVCLCLIVWTTAGSKAATIASTLAMLFAGLPVLRDSFTKPHESPFFIWICYLTANILSSAGGKDWSIEERFYPTTAAIYSFVNVTASSRKFWSPKFQTVKSAH